MAAGQAQSPLAGVPLFEGLSLESLCRLAEQSWTRRYPEGQVLTSEGDPGDSLLVVEEGEVRISRYTPSGQEVVLAMVEAPDAIGELALIDGAPRSATITAQTAVQIRVVPRAAFLQFLESNPQAMLAVMRIIAGLVRATNERLSDILSLDVPGRVAKWLLVRAADRGERTDRGLVVPFELSQGELATELGTTRVSINKALKTFESLNAIELHGESILLKNTDLLIEYTY
jgi:CRP/FNR family cyclic AMP-dependent transcriptional regulator